MRVDKRKRRLGPLPTPLVAGDQKISELPLREALEATDEFPLIAGGVNYRAPVALLATASESGNTVDTNEPYRMIMLSDGTVRAIPFDAVPPTTPVGLAAIARLTSVNLTWDITVGAVQYQVDRDGEPIATLEAVASWGSVIPPSYRDTDVTVDTTYSYTVSSIDQYQQRSPPTAPVTATTSLDLNSAPVDVEIHCWPTPIPTDGPAFIRVSAREIDIQNISFLLNVDAGSLSATDDPSLWIIRI